jgi:8-oxo-dGTP pyrophosphatase MutT (NUDIX family)
MKHTESAGGVVLNTRGEVLVVNQRGLTWSLPKGHIDPGEDALAAARREIREESGVSELDLIKPLGRYARHRIALHGGDDLSERKTIHMFLFRTVQTDLRPLDKDNPEARWVAPDRVTELLTHKRDREFFESILSEI